jgi:hypothetical protein
MAWHLSSGYLFALSILHQGGVVGALYAYDWILLDAAERQAVDVGQA